MGRLFLKNRVYNDGEIKMIIAGVIEASHVCSGS